MLTEAASVLGRDGSILHLQASRHTTCNGCSLKTGCGQYLLARTRGGPRHDDRLTLTHLELTGGMAAYKAGDPVRIELPGGHLVLLAMCFYAVPLGLLLLATGLAAWLEAGEGVLVLSGLAALVVGSVLTRRLLAVQAVQSRFAPRVHHMPSAGACAGSAS